MSFRHARSLGLLFCLAAAASAPILVNCAAPTESDDGSDGDLSEDAVTGVSNPLGLRLTYDATTGQVNATIKDSLKSGEQLRIRVRRGMPTLTSQKELDCSSLTSAKPLSGEGSREGVVGKVIYRGPKIDQSMLSVLKVYDDPRWQTDAAWARTELAKLQQGGGPKVLVEACIMQGTKVKAKLQTDFAYAWDQGNLDSKLGTKSLHFQSGDAGLGDGGGGDPAPAPEQALNSMEEYGKKCVEELGEIPFFKKLADGKYDTFDCRDFAGTGDGHQPTPMEGVEGTLIPITAEDVPVTKCDGEGPNGKKDFGGYDCVSKCDHAEMLSEGCEVGPTVTHAKNDKGTHWALLCRKVGGGEQVGWNKTKTFNDIAMIGSNPKTGKTCFFQNMIGSGTDGEHVPHPADVEKSRTLWDSPKGYCFQSCHGTDPFIQSPWIHGAKKSNGNPVVPMMGMEPDIAISYLESPYYVVNMDAQGWTIPKQLVSDGAGACQTCHRVGGDQWMSEFANWTTGQTSSGKPLTEGDSYWNKITDGYKKFEKAHYMPMRLDGLTADNWDQSAFKKAMDHINKCRSNEADPECEWADVPRGAGNPAAPNR